MTVLLSPPGFRVRATIVCALMGMISALLFIDGTVHQLAARDTSIKSRSLISYARSASVKGLKTSRSVSGLDHRLRRLLGRIEQHYGKPVRITSGCRSKKRNRRAGGARRSYHLRCMAADIKVAGISERNLLRFVRRLPDRGGVGTYCRNSIVHLDVGPRREWHQRCRRRKRR